jgi:hypothetical protein
MFKSIFILLFVLGFAYSQNSIDGIGVSDARTPASTGTFVAGDSVFVRMDITTTATLPLILINPKVKFVTALDGTGTALNNSGTSGDFAITVIGIDTTTSYFEFVFLLPATIHSSINSFRIELGFADNDFNPFVPPLESIDGSLTVPTNYVTFGTISQPPTINTLGFRSEQQSDTGTYGSQMAVNDSLHIDFTVSVGTVPANAYRVRIYQLDATNNILTGLVDVHNNVAIIEKSAGNYRINVRSNFSTFHTNIDHLVVGVRLNSGEDRFLSAALDEDDQPSGYMLVNSAPTLNENSGSVWYTSVTPDIIVLDELGVRDNDDDNDYITIATDSLHIEFGVSAGIVPSTASAVRVYQVNASDVELVSQQVTNVPIIQNGANYEMTILNPFKSSFDGSLDHFVVTVQVRSTGSVYASRTISGEPTFVVLNNAEVGWFISMNDGTPAVSELGIRSSVSQDRELNSNEGIDVVFTVGENDEVPDTSSVTIYEFNGDIQVGSPIVRNHVAISGSGTGPYSMSISGISLFNSSTDSIAILLNISNTPVDYVTKSQITGTFVSENSVTGFAGNSYPTLGRTNNPPTANTSFEFRYGAPNDNNIYLTWNSDAVANEPVGLKEFRLVYNTAGVVSASDTTGTGFVDFPISTQTNYELNVAGATVGVRLFTIDNNNEIASIALNGNSTINFADGLTYTISGNAYTVPNISSGVTTDNPILIFDIDSSGLSQPLDNATLSSITLTTADSNDNVTSSILSNIRVFLDNGTIQNVLDGGDFLLNSSAANWSETSLFISLNQNNTLDASTYRYIVVADATNATDKMKINVSLAASNYALANDGTISAANTALLTGSVGPQGQEGDGDITLPVSLIDGSFSAKKLKDGFELSAETASEENVKYIRYERSFADKPIEDLLPTDWEDTNLKIESSSEYISQGRVLPKMVDKISLTGKTKLRYRMYTEELDGTFKKHYADNKNIIEIDENVLTLASYSLKQNYPNPFNPVTNIAFDVPYRANVTLEIYNILGQKVRTLLENELLEAKKNHIFQWNGKSDAGQKVASGVYVYRMFSKDGKFKESKKMILVK